MGSSHNSYAESGTPGALRADGAQIAEWIDLVHGRSNGLINVCQTGDWSGVSRTDVNDAAHAALTMDATNPEGIYLRITTLASTKPGQERRRGKDIESLECPGFAGDMDLASPARGEFNERSGLAYPPDHATAMSIVEASGLPIPTLWVDSGWGLYPWWLLIEPLAVNTNEGRARFKVISDHIQKTLNYTAHDMGWDYGLGIGDLSRVLRVPGTVNRKVKNDPRMCYILSQDGTPYDLDELADLVAIAYENSPKPVIEVPRPPVPAYDTSLGLRPGDDFNLRGSWLDILPQHGWKVHRYLGNGHIQWTRPGKEFGISASTGRDPRADRLYVFTTSTEFEARTPINKHYALSLLEFNGDVSACTSYLRSQGFGGELPQRNRPVDVTSLVRPAAQVPVAVQAVDDQQTAQAILPVQADQALTVHKDLPEIDLGSEQEAMVEICRVISSGMIPNLYVKDGILTHVHPKTNSACSEVTVVPVTADLLNMLLAEHTRTFKWVSGGKDNPPVRKPCAPSITHLRAVVSKTYWPTVPELTGVVGTPTLRPDGSLIQECGYDKRTALFYGPAVKVATVPEQISEEQVRRSREYVFGKVFGEFCWSSVGDFSNYMALLLSPMLRPYFKSTTPFGMVTATTRGSGKTNLTDAIGLLYGQTSQVLPGRTEELQKKVTSILAGNSSPVVVFDNLKEGSTVSSEILATLITKDKWDDRMLGASKNIEATNDRLWLASGNGLTVGGDMASRTVMVRLDPKMARPELRQFEMGQFSDWIREGTNREDLLWHLLILVQAWVKAGAVEDDSHTMRGFTRWARVMGGLLKFHGLTGFLSNVDDLAARDTDEEEWGIFLAKWHEIFGSGEQMARQVHASAQVDWVMGTSVDRWARCFITDDEGLTPTPKKLGNMLHGKADRFFGKYILRKRRDTVTNSTMWWVERGEEA